MYLPVPDEKAFPCPKARAVCAGRSDFYQGKRIRDKNITFLDLAGKGKGGCEGGVPPSIQSAGPALPVRGVFLRSRACPAGAKMRSLQIFRLGFAAPGKQASGLFSARTGRQALDVVDARGKSVRGFRRGERKRPPPVADKGR